VSASATTAPGHAHTYAGKTAYEQARPLDLSEIPEIIEQYRQAARNAINAGFDGIQLHASNGYLIDQFLRDSDNLRTDNYGGSRQNRIRLLAEITQAVSDEIGANRVGVRLSPNCETHGIRYS
ncbi:alkene reductase, partial [Chromobacterium vaccinii]